MLFLLKTSRPLPWLWPAWPPCVQRPQPLTCAAGRFYGAFSATLGFPNLPNMRVQECASLALQGKVLHVSSCIAFLTALGPARAPGQLESSRSAPTRRAARSGECRAYPVVFGLPCPFAFNARAGCARLCCAHAHYLCAQVGVPGPAPAPARGPVPAPAPGPRPGPATLTGRCRAGA